MVQSRTGLFQTIKKLFTRDEIKYQYSLWIPFLTKIPLGEFLKPQKLRLILLARRYTFLSYDRLSILYELARQTDAMGTPGAFVECGVCNGGSAGVVSDVFRNDKERHIWLFDSWEGLPEPKDVDVDFSGEAGEEGTSFGYEERVRDLLFHRLRLSEENIHLQRGWFEDTIPAARADIGAIALMHLDGDWYQSIKLCLEELYDQVIKGGFIVVDDYWFWEGCRKAVDDFIAERALDVELTRVDIAAYFQKP